MTRHRLSCLNHGPVRVLENHFLVSLKPTPLLKLLSAEPTVHPKPLLQCQGQYISNLHKACFDPGSWAVYALSSVRLLGPLHSQAIHARAGRLGNLAASAGEPKKLRKSGAGEQATTLHFPRGYKTTCQHGSGRCKCMLQNTSLHIAAPSQLPACAREMPAVDVNAKRVEGCSTAQRRKLHLS